MERINFASRKKIIICAILFFTGIVTCMIPVRGYMPHHLSTFSYLAMIIITLRSWRSPLQTFCSIRYSEYGRQVDIPLQKPVNKEYNDAYIPDRECSVRGFCIIDSSRCPSRGGRRFEGGRVRRRCFYIIYNCSAIYYRIA